MLTLNSLGMFFPVQLLEKWWQAVHPSISEAGLRKIRETKRAEAERDRERDRQRQRVKERERECE